jgi:hypothetical protein
MNIDPFSSITSSPTFSFSVASCRYCDRILSAPFKHYAIDGKHTW